MTQSRNSDVAHCVILVTTVKAYLKRISMCKNSSLQFLTSNKKTNCCPAKTADLSRVYLSPVVCTHKPPISDIRTNTWPDCLTPNLLTDCGSNLWQPNHFSFKLERDREATVPGSGSMLHTALYYGLENGSQFTNGKKPSLGIKKTNSFEIRSSSPNNHCKWENFTKLLSNSHFQDWTMARKCGRTVKSNTWRVAFNWCSDPPKETNMVTSVFNVLHELTSSRCGMGRNRS